MGSPDPRSFSRGKRGVAGQMIFTQFDRDALLEEMRKSYKNAPSVMQYQAFRATNQSSQEFADAMRSSENPYGIETWDSIMTRLGYAQGGDFNAESLTDFYDPEFADQLMPFNISIVMANEFGQRAGMEIYDVQILNEGSGFSVDDVMVSKAYTFVARKIKGIQRKENLRNSGSDSALSSAGQSFRQGLNF